MSLPKIITSMLVLMTMMFASFYVIFERNYEVKVSGVENFVAPDMNTPIDSTQLDEVYNCGTEVNYDIYQLRENYFKKNDELTVKVVIHYFPNDTVCNLEDSTFIDRMQLASEFYRRSGANMIFEVQNIFTHYGTPQDDPQLLTAIQGFESFLGKTREDLRSYYYGLHNDFHHSKLGQSDVLNIYIYNDSKSEGFAGQAGGIESNYFAVNLRYTHPDLYTIEHEIGHCYGLWHTHQLDGSDDPHSRDDGDFICTTHKTFPLSTIVDINCKIFRDWESRLRLPKISNPISSWDNIEPSDQEILIKNLMSYTKHSCRQEINPEQIQRMRKIIETNTDLRSTIKGIDKNFKQNIIKSLAEIDV